MFVVDTGSRSDQTPKSLFILYMSFTLYRHVETYTILCIVLDIHRILQNNKKSCILA